MIKIKPEHVAAVSCEVAKVGQRDFLFDTINEMAKSNPQLLLLINSIAEQSLDYDQVVKAAILTFRLLNLASENQKSSEVNKS